MAHFECSNPIYELESRIPPNLAFLKSAKIGLRTAAHPPNFTSSTAGDAEKLLLIDWKLKSRRNYFFIQQLWKTVHKQQLITAR
jgi:hypothetical protein